MSDDELVEETESAAPKPSRIKTGWCLTNDHRRCPVRFGKLECTCSCPDHGVDFVPSQPNDQLSEQLKSVLRNHGQL